MTLTITIVNLVIVAVALLCIWEARRLDKSARQNIKHAQALLEEIEAITSQERKQVWNDYEED